MKKLLAALFVSAATSSGLSAQDFSPSQQAQGYLDAQNTTVDHATGLFHYRVPIYTLRSGDFELPISLNYVGKGVKVDDKPGLVGFNWNLNTGGIVTRTIRGGIADEAYWEGGYLHQNFSNPPTQGQIDSVDKRLIDGESDIFTAVFNGQSVNFIIKKDGNQIIAEPLERTNVKIECEYTGHIAAPTIDGWVITDENGNKFYFRQKEWSSDIILEDAISFNGVRNKSYISSWHLSRIEPRNGNPIIYNYREAVDIYDTEQKNIYAQTYFSEYESMYYYGQPMWGVASSFMNHRDNFIDMINLAKGALNDDFIELQLGYLSTVIRETGLIMEPFYQIFDRSFQIMGQLADLTKMTSAVSEMLELLYEYYSLHGNHYILAAIDILIHYLTAQIPIDEKLVSGGTYMVMRSPILTYIRCDKTVVRFDYWNSYSDLSLKSVKVHDIADNEVLNVHLAGDSNLAQLSFTGKDGTEFNRIKFDYHYQSNYYNKDVYGFPNNDNNKDIFSPLVDKEYSKAYSLSKITTMDGGQILIDYEPNVIHNLYNGYIDTMDFGGIRIKSLVLIDPLTGGEPDVILYHYPYPGELVYTDYTNTETVDYGGFSDLILFSKAKSKGLAFLNLGNHGVYYDYVEEEFVGKGKKTYLFLNPRRLALSTPASSYKFWLNGLPLGVATYDNAGNLRSLTRNRYCADVDVSDYFKLHPNGKNIYPSGSWFPSNNNHTKYLSTKPQIKAYEYYMDFNDLASYYYNEQDDVYLGWHAGWYSFNPYNDVFLPNIAPRTNAASPEDQRWELVYGGKVLLKSQEEFRIEGNDPLLSGPCIGHFVADLGTPFNKVEYFYDNVAE
ncbi:MAG: hypothetical protein FWE10_06280, partial [Rikenellaceae bacterium]|nr:hypothetical protein [Rikenellaceae bacterium]MCL2693282.1 hypothetical protein [Rikenellaceae bacterium]